MTTAQLRKPPKSDWIRYRQTKSVWPQSFWTISGPPPAETQPPSCSRYRDYSRTLKTRPGHIKSGRFKEWRKVRKDV